MSEDAKANSGSKNLGILDCSPWPTDRLTFEYGNMGIDCAHLEWRLAMVNDWIEAGCVVFNTPEKMTVRTLEQMLLVQPDNPNYLYALQQYKDRHEAEVKALEREHKERVNAALTSPVSCEVASS